MFKKIIAGLLIACMAITMVACSGDDKKPADTKAEADGTNAGTEAQATEAPVTEPATEAPATEAPETNPPKVYTYEEVYKIDFAAMEDAEKYGSGVSGIQDLRIEGGMLRGTSISGDPFFQLEGIADMNIDPTQVQKIVVRYYNHGDSDAFQMFFTNSATSWAEPASFKNSADYCGEDGDTMNEIELWTDESDLWTEDVTTGIRLDVLQGEGDFEVVDITFYKEIVTEG